MKLEVKICGITRLCDAECAVEAGADYLGFVLVRASKRFIAPEELARMAVLPVKKVGVFVDAELDFIRGMVETGRLDARYHPAVKRNDGRKASHPGTRLRPAPFRTDNAPSHC